ncbi:alkaline phosphatase D family protein [Bdellovibrio sp. HCB337]|uniref:alkaline phosphatase D family protein n=1 Tax=Bdellovibrio sp. HCB337 TaxID=3394358 RepID=UPI0039A76003
MAQKKSSLARRQFLRGLAATPLLLSAGAAQAESESEIILELQSNRRVPMLQVWADETSSLVTVLGNVDWGFNCVGATSPQVSIVKAQKLRGTDLVLYRLHLEGLSISDYCQLNVFNEHRKLVDTRQIKGLDLAATDPKIAVVSCANFRKLKNQKIMYKRLHDQNPDLMLFIGDIVYSNSKTSSVLLTPEDPSTALERYLTTWITVDLYQLDPLIPTLAVWDDHDYGANNGDHSHPYKSEMKEIFRSFYPMPESHQRLSYGPGVSFRLTAFGIDFHMMDARTNKVPERTQWGSQQEAWLAREFNNSTNPAWILNGVQYFKYFVVIESMEKSAEPSLTMLKNLLRSRRKPTVLFSGDVHCSQVQELPASLYGFKTYEITSSGIHCGSAGKLLKRSPEEGQLYYCGSDNFLMVRPRVQARAMDLRITCANEFGVESVSSSPLRISV